MNLYTAESRDALEKRSHEAQEIYQGPMCETTKSLPDGNLKGISFLNKNIFSWMNNFLNE